MSHENKSLETSETLVSSGGKRHERDYLERTIETIRNHRSADNCWPQWANILADEVECLWQLEAEYDFDHDRREWEAFDAWQRAGSPTPTTGEPCPRCATGICFKHGTATPALPNEEVTERERSDAGQRIETGHDEPVASRSVTSLPEQETGAGGGFFADSGAGGGAASPLTPTPEEALTFLESVYMDDEYQAEERYGAALAVLRAEQERHSASLTAHHEAAIRQETRAVAAEVERDRYREALRGTEKALTLWETAVGEINAWPRECREALAAARAVLGGEPQEPQTQDGGSAASSSGGGQE